MNRQFTRFLAWLKKHTKTRTVIIIVLFVLCILEVHALTVDLRDTYQTGDTFLQYQQGRMVRVRDIVTPMEIQPWMTFSYINFVFKLPENYLKTVLSVNDARYPNMQMTRYVRMNHLNSAQFLLQVRQAVSEYKP